MNLSVEIKGLEHFASQEDVAKILEDLKRLHDNRSYLGQLFYASPVALSEAEKAALIRTLKPKLVAVIKRAEREFIAHQSIWLADAAHAALIALVKVSPENETDPADWESIPAAKQVVIAGGRQYNIDNLVRHHNTRPAHKTGIEKKLNCKQLLDPLTNIAFSRRDSAHILRVAKAKGLKLRWLVRDGAEEVNLIENAAELKQWMAQRTPEEIADFLARIESLHSYYGPDLATTLKQLDANLTKQQATVQQAQATLNLYSTIAWRARAILGACAVVTFGCALSCLRTAIVNDLENISSSSCMAVGFSLVAGLATYGMMATPKAIDLQPTEAPVSSL